jgi:hypothetical protein
MPVKSKRKSSADQKAQVKGVSRDEIINMLFAWMNRANKLEKYVRSYQKQLTTAQDTAAERRDELRKLRDQHSLELTKERCNTMMALQDRDLADLILEGVSLDPQYDVYDVTTCNCNTYSRFLGCYLKKGHSLYCCKECGLLMVFEIATKTMVDSWWMRENLHPNQCCESSLLGFYLAKREKLI